MNTHIIAAMSVSILCTISIFGSHSRPAPICIKQTATPPAAQEESDSPLVMHCCSASMLREAALKRHLPCPGFVTITSQASKDGSAEATGAVVKIANERYQLPLDAAQYCAPFLMLIEDTVNQHEAEMLRVIQQRDAARTKLSKIKEALALPEREIVHVNVQDAQTQCDTATADLQQAQARRYKWSTAAFACTTLMALATHLPVVQTSLSALLQDT